jgi:hypothetical protein
LARSDAASAGWRIYDFPIDTFVGNKDLSVSGRPISSYVTINPSLGNIVLVSNFDIDDVSSVSGIKIYIAAIASNPIVTATYIFYTYQKTIDAITSFTQNASSIQSNIYQYRYLQMYIDNNKKIIDPNNIPVTDFNTYFGIDYNPTNLGPNTSLWQNSTTEFIIDPNSNNEYIAFAASVNITTPITRGHYVYVGRDRTIPSETYLKWATPNGISELPGYTDLNSLVTLCPDSRQYDRIYLISNYCQ